MQKRPGLILSLILLLMAGVTIYGCGEQMRADEDKGFRWLEKTGSGYACGYEVLGVAGECPHDIGDTIYVYCIGGKEGSCKVNDEAAKLFQEENCHLQLKCIDPSCKMRKDNGDVYMAIDS